MRKQLEYFRVTMHDKQIFLIFTKKITPFAFAHGIVDEPIRWFTGLYFVESTG